MQIKDLQLKRVLRSALLVLLLNVAGIVNAQVSTWDGSWEPWTHGTGTEADPFLIENAQQLAYLAYRVNNGLDAAGGHVSNHDYHYKLMVDIDLNGSEDFQWTPIGYWNSYDNYQCFGGCFDGNGYAIFSLYQNSSSICAGFFGYTDGALIKNLKINSGTIINTSTYNAGAPYGYTGGIIGWANNSIIENSYNKASLSSNYIVGGMIGYANSDAIIITNSYNTGHVAGTMGGGIVGAVYYEAVINITNCYNIGEVNAQYKGGIVGYGWSLPSVNNCYYLNTCCNYDGYGGESKTEIYMKSSEFMDLLNNGTCSWESDNTNTNNGYPILTMVSYGAETYHATEIGTTSATLHGSVSIENTNAISKGFEYRKMGDLNYSSIIITNNSNYFSYNLSGLDTNTTYEYRTFVNVADCDIISYGEIESFEVTWLNLDTISIYDADMLRWVSEQCNSGTTFQGKYIKLMNDITLPLNVPNNMTSIGVYPNYPFMGTFDGNGMHITNLYIDQPNTPYQGFFGYTLNANLYNVGLVNITASGRNYTGGMVAYAKNTHLRDCYVNGGTLFALSYCGGLVGYQEQGTNSIISGCYNTCEVSGNNYVGGLVGFSNYSTVRNSYVAAMVAAQGDAVGSIIGGANEVLMYYTYFNAELTGQTNAIGWNNTGGGKDGGEAMTSAQMRNPQFVATLNSGLTVHVWKQDYASQINNGFPILQWQQGTGVDENETLPVAVYPNPTNGKITIEAESLKRIAISNMLGQVLYESNISDDVFEYDFSKYGAGLYLIRIETASGVAVKKISVK